MTKAIRLPGPLVVWAGALLFWLAAAQIALAAPTFPKLTGRVVDEANLLSPAAEQSLTSRLEALETRNRRQLVVVTVPSLQGQEIEDYGYQLGRAWGVGQKGANDGALLLVAPTERKVRIEVGYGLEGVLTDALSSVIIQQQILPRFRAGDMEAGVVAGADSLIQQLSLDDAEAQKRALAAVGQAKKSGKGGFPVFLVVLIVFFLFNSLSGLGRRGRRGRGGLGSAWPIIFMGGGGGGGGWSSGGGGGGFSGGGGSFGGGGSSGGW